MKRSVYRLPAGKAFEVVAQAYPESFSMTRGLPLPVMKREGAGYEIRRTASGAEIAFGERSDLMRALGSLLARPGLVKESVEPAMTFRGVMLDVSRNGVLRPEFLKKVLLRLSLLGINYVCLYTEDTYEVAGHPMIGYRRGKYTKADIRDLDRYAEQLGMTMFPCIQTLGHMEQILKLQPYRKLKDSDHVISVIHPETKQFIETLLREASEPYKSRVIHVGMDETFGIGRGRAFDKISGVDPQELYVDHAAFIGKTCAKLGLEPMMWGDVVTGKHGSRAMPLALFRRIPKNMKLVYWDYYEADLDKYRRGIQQCRDMGREPLCSPGISSWNCLWPIYGKLLNSMPQFVSIAKEMGVKEMMVTSWGDDGQECPFDANWAGLCMFAEGVYERNDKMESVKARMKGVTGADYDAFEKIGGLEALPVKERCIGAPGKVLLWEDPMGGRISHHLGRKRLAGYYRGLGRFIAGYRSRGPRDFSDVLDYAMCLANVMELKADLFNETRSAYVRRDKAALRKIMRRIDVLTARVDMLWKARRRLWLAEFRPFGWEILDLRFGGLKARLATMKMRVGDYLNGKTDRIEELDEKPLKEFGDLASTVLPHRQLCSLCNI